MEQRVFEFDRLKLEAVERMNGDWIFQASAVLLGCELISKSNNCADWLANHVPPKWYLEFKIPGKKGRPSLYLTESGLYFVVSQSKTDLGYWLRDKIFEEVLPSIRKTGAYKSPDMTLKQRLESIKEDLDVLANNPKLQANLRNAERSEISMMQEGKRMSAIERSEIYLQNLTPDEMAILALQQNRQNIENAIAFLSQENQEP